MILKHKGCDRDQMGDGVMMEENVKGNPAAGHHDKGANCQSLDHSKKHN